MWDSNSNSNYQWLEETILLCIGVQFDFETIVINSEFYFSSFLKTFSSSLFLSGNNIFLIFVAENYSHLYLPTFIN